jgi:hypothetical protein
VEKTTRQVSITPLLANCALPRCVSANPKFFLRALYTRMELHGTAGSLTIQCRLKPGQHSRLTLQQEKEKTIRVRSQELYLSEIEIMADVIIDKAAPHLPLQESRWIIQSLVALHQSAEFNKPVLL